MRFFWNRNRHSTRLECCSRCGIYMRQFAIKVVHSLHSPHTDTQMPCQQSAFFLRRRNLSKLLSSADRPLSAPPSLLSWCESTLMRFNTLRQSLHGSSLYYQTTQQWREEKIRRSGLLQPCFISLGSATSGPTDTPPANRLIFRSNPNNQNISCVIFLISQYLKSGFIAISIASVLDPLWTLSEKCKYWGMRL